MTARLDIESDSSDLLKTAVDLDAVAQKAVEAGVAIDRLSDVTQSSVGATQAQNAAVRTASTAISAEVDAIQRAFAAQNAFTQATREQAAVTRAATAELHTMRFGVANVAAQFQDILVTSQVGMNPLIVALQQGTQLSQAFAGQGGRGALGMIAAGFASILSPVSLLTIALVGLGSAGLSALFSMLEPAEDVGEALENHKKWLDEVLVGYDQAAEAADRAATAAMKIPQEILEEDLADKADEQVSALKRWQTELEGVRGQLDETIDFLDEMKAVAEGMGSDTGALANAQAQVELLKELGINAASTTDEIVAAELRLREFMKATDDPALKQMAADVLALMGRLRGLQGELDMTRGALGELQAQAAEGIYTRGFGIEEQLKSIQRMTPELRTVKEQMQDAFDLAAPQARTMSELQALVDATTKGMNALDEQERRREAEKAAREAASRSKRGGAASEKAENRWGEDLASVDREIEQMRLEARLLGQSTRAAETARKEFELLNEAKQRGQEITPELTRQVEQLAAAYGLQAEELEKAKERQEEWDDRIEFARDLSGNFLTDTKNKLKETGDLWGALADASENALDRTMDRMLQAVNDQVWDLLASQLFGIIGGGLGGGAKSGIGLIPGLGGIKANALGGVYESSSLSAMSNRVVGTPTLFPFAKGIGLLGEAGNEAIMPLQRGPDGSLGVRGTGGGGDVMINMTVIEGAGENRAEATKDQNGNIDVKVWLMAEVTKEASTRGTPLNKVIRSAGGSQLTQRG